MNTVRKNELPEAEKLALAQKAFSEFHAQCFWYMRQDMQVTPADLPEIARGHRRHFGAACGAWPTLRS